MSSKALFLDGFTYRYDDGREEHFYLALFGGYKGAKGSRIDPVFLGGYKAIRYDGYTEMAKISACLYCDGIGGMLLPIATVAEVWLVMRGVKQLLANRKTRTRGIYGI